MTLKSLSTKLYLGMAVAALAAWAVGVPGRTVLTFAAVGFMIAMHAGGHHSHGGGAHGGHGGRGVGDSRLGRSGGDTPGTSTEEAGQDTSHPTEPGSAVRGCH